MIEDGAWTEWDAVKKEQQRVTGVYQTKVDLCLARIERLTNRLRTQEWSHELFDQESDDDIDRMVGGEPRSTPPRREAQQVRVPTTEIERWINRFREEFRNHAADGTTSPFSTVPRRTGNGHFSARKGPPRRFFGEKPRKRGKKTRDGEKPRKRGKNPRPLRDPFATPSRPLCDPFATPLPTPLRPLCDPFATPF